MKSELTILLLEDNPDDAELIESSLRAGGIECRIVHAETRAEFLAAIEANGLDLILSDYALPSFDGLSALKIAREKLLGTPFIFVSGTMGEELAIETLKSGATDYVLKHRLAQLGPAVRRAMAESEERTARQAAERSRAEAWEVAAAALRASEERYRRILEAAPDAVVILNRRGEIALVNTQAERMFGYSRELLLCRDSALLFPERLRTEHLRKRETYFANFETQMAGSAVELIGKRMDGTEFPMEARLSPLETDDDTLVFAAFRDVTERRDAEQRSRQLEITTAQAEASNRAKSIFLSTMSHEIRTPMNAIMGYSQLMLRDPRLGPDSIANLKIINRSGEHLLNIITNVLDMAKIEAGRLQVTPKNCHLTNLLRDIEAMFRLPAEAKGVQFALLISGEPVEYIVADEGNIRQVLINLIGNALKFIERGRVDLQVSLDVRAAGGLWLTADIKDTGIGMTVEEQSRLFQPFVQGAGGQQIHHGGTGLGLAISRGLASAMGGDITVKSSAGSGSTFRFEIPIKRGAEPDFRAESGRPGRAVGIKAGQEAPRILIVDDLPDNREWLSRLLTALGFSVRTEENGEAAVLAWSVWNPHLILMDVHMPVMCGLEATRRIRSSPTGSDTVIIALTADAMEEHRRAVLNSGADAFVSKPCSEGELLEQIRAHLGLAYRYEETVDDTGVAALQAATSVEQGTEQLATLPIDLLKQLRDATLSGDNMLLDKLILSIGAPDVHIAGPLRELADTFQYDRLIQWLEGACAR